MLMCEEVLAQQIAFNLARPGFDLAFVWHRKILYYSYYPQGAEGPSSAVLQLLQGLFEQFIDHSFFILRNRIVATAILEKKCQGMVRIVAERAHGEIEPTDHGLKITCEKKQVGEDGGILSSKYLSAENQLPLATVAELRSASLSEWVRRL